MPELPEVETIRRKLEPKIIGKTITNIEILSAKNFIGDKKNVIGKKIVKLERYGKILSLKLTTTHSLQPTTYLSFHLKLTGQIIFVKDTNNQKIKHKIPFLKENHLPAKTTRVIIKFKDKSGLFFNDLRKFGWIKATNFPVKPKGIDVLSKDFTLHKLIQLITTNSRPIKLFLMDQDKIAGIGNIYANDALWLSKIHPMKKSKSLTKEEVKKLFQAIKKTISEGLKYNGSSDVSYILPDASTGNYQKHFKVYAQEGEKCLRCKTIIKRVKHAGRSYFYCPRCQKI